MALEELNWCFKLTKKMKGIGKEIKEYLRESAVIMRSNFLYYDIDVERQLGEFCKNYNTKNCLKLYSRNLKVKRAA